MGLRHLRGLRGAEAIAVVDPSTEAAEAALALAHELGLGGRITVHRSLDEVDAAVDLAVLAETAEGRLERVERVLGLGVGRVLLEKPLEQSRVRLHRLLDLAAGADADVRCNLGVRRLPSLTRLRSAGGPFVVAVVGGAYGLACNGIHWIDAAVSLAGPPGRLLFAELEETPIASPRGAQFRDWGGRALYGFADGSRLSLDCSATGAAPMFATASGPSLLAALDLHAARAILWERDPAHPGPPWRYGADFERREVDDALDLPQTTAEWAAGGGALPPLLEAAPAHELLFDLLETAGGDRFPIT
jgi:hypothetical protein